MESHTFIEVIKSIGPDVIISDEYIHGDILIDFNLTATTIRIEKCTFQDRVTFENSDLNFGIHFIECTFQKSLTFKDCNATNFDHEANFLGYHLQFTKTHFNSLIFSGINNIERGVYISNKSNIDYLSIRNLVSNLGSFRISESSVNRILEIYNFTSKNSFSIQNNCDISAKVSLGNLNTSSIDFLSSSFKNVVFINHGKTNSIVFNDGFFEKEINIELIMVVNDLTIIGTKFNKTVAISAAAWHISFNLIYIKACTIGERLIFEGNNQSINKLELISSKQLSGDFFFNYSRISKAFITGLNYNNSFVFNACEISNLEMNDLQNFSTITFNGLHAAFSGTKINISHSNIGKTQFYNIDMDTFKEINIVNSVLTEIVLINVQWFNEKKLNPTAPVDSQAFTQRKEIFRQFKFALEKQGDRISSLRFKSLEMKAYKNELFASTKWYDPNHIVDRFILWVGQTNDFGLNWFKPAALAAGFTLLFYFLITVGISEKLDYYFDFSNESFITTWQELYNHRHALPQLLNPTSNIENIFPSEHKYGFRIYLLDYTLKIILAFLIFQVISAFRKYMK